MDSYKAKQRDKYYQVVDMAVKENEELRKRQSEGKDLDKPRPMGFNINSLAEQWYKLKQENRFKRRF